MGDLYMSEDTFRGICREYSSTILDGGDICNAFWIVYDILKAEAEALKAREPWATNEIDRLNDAALEVLMLESDVTDTYENVMEH